MVERLCDRVFEGCTSLKKVTLPQRLTAIGSLVFAGCRNLTLISVPGNVTIIGEGAFQDVGAKFIMQCAAGSAAENYARKNRLSYQLE